MNERYFLGARNIFLVLAKEIFEWCLVAEDIIVIAQKIIYT